MSNTPFRRVRAKRAIEAPQTADDLDFDSVEDTAETDEPRSALHRGLASLAVSALALVAVGGVVVAAGPGSQKIDTASVSPDKLTSDITRAVPAPDALTVQQQVQSQVARSSKVQGQTKGTLGAFAGRTTVTRSAERAELSQAVTAEGAVVRQDSLDDVSNVVVQAATAAGASTRDDQITVDHARVKAEAARIAEQKRAAEAKLAKMKADQAAAAKKAAKTSTTPAAKTSTATAAAPASAPVGDVSAIVTSGGGTTPIAPGHYTVGAAWGATGSWARWHTGQDFPAPIGTPIRAVADGVASTDCAGCQAWAGDSVLVLHHANGGSTLYAHMARYTVKPGQVVKAGQVIGYVGMKGRTFGPHLHFEYYPAGTTPGDVYSTSNPITFLLSLGVHV